jgi:hypothetical protein
VDLERPVQVPANGTSKPKGMQQGETRGHIFHCSFVNCHLIAICHRSDNEMKNGKWQMENVLISLGA